MARSPANAKKTKSSIIPESALVAAGGLVLAFAVAAYWYRFHVKLEYPSAVDPAVWGQFGDFIGGLLNPLVALLALIVLGRGVQIQRTEFRGTINAISADTLLRAAETCWKDIGELLRETVVVELSVGGKRSDYAGTIHGMLNKDGIDIYSAQPESVSKDTQSIRPYFVALSGLVHELDSLLLHVEGFELPGHALVAGQFRRKAETVVNRMLQLKLVNESTCNHFSLSHRANAWA